MKPALFQIDTKYAGEGVKAFKRDIKQINAIIGGLNKLSRASTGVNQAAKYVQTFAKQVAGINPVQIGTLHQIGGAMEKMASSTDKLAGATAELDKFSNLIMKVGQRTAKSTKAWPAGIEAMKQMAKVLRQLGGSGESAKNFASLITVLEKTPSSGGMLSSLHSLSDVVPIVQKIKEQLLAIDGMRLSFGIAGGGTGEKGGGKMGVLPSVGSRFRFTDPAYMKQSEKWEQQLLFPKEKIKQFDSAKHIDAFSKKMLEMDAATFEKQTHILEYVTKIANLKRELMESDRSYNTKVYNYYKKNLDRLQSASGIASASRGMFFGEASKGTPLSGAMVRGTLAHQQIGGYLQSLGVKPGGRLKQGFQQALIQRSWEGQTPMAEEIAGTGPETAREFDRVMKGKYQGKWKDVSQEDWYIREREKLTKLVPRTIKKILDHLYKMVSESFRGGITEGVKELQLLIEKEAKPAWLIKPGAGSLKGRIAPGMQGDVGRILSKMKSRMGSSQYKEQTKFLREGKGIPMGGTPDIAALIPKLGKGEVLDIKTGDASVKSLKYALTQLRVYMNLLAKEFPEINQIVKSIIPLEGKIEPVEQAIKGAIAKKGAGLVGKIGVPGVVPPTIAREITMPREIPIPIGPPGVFPPTVTVEIANLSKQIAESKKKESEYAGKTTQEEIKQTQEMVKQVGMGGGRYGGPPRGGPPGGGIGLRAMMPQLGEQTGIERTWNKIVLESHAFGDEVDRSTAKTELLKESIRRVSGQLARVVSLEEFRKDPQLQSIQAYDKMEKEVAEYARMVEFAESAERRRAEVVTKSGLRTEARIKKEAAKIKTEDFKALGLQDPRRERITSGQKASTELLKLTSQLDANKIAMDNWGNTLRKTMTEPDKATSKLAERFKAILGPLGLLGIKVKDNAHAMEIWTSATKKLYKSIENSKEALKGFHTQLRTDRELLDKLVGSKKGVINSDMLMATSTENLYSSEKQLQNMRKNINKEIDKTRRLREKSIQTSGMDSKATRLHSRRLSWLSRELGKVEKGYTAVNTELNIHKQRVEGMRGVMRTTLVGFKNMLKSQLAWVAGYGLMFGAMYKFKQALGSSIDLQQQMARAMRTSRSEIMTSTHIMNEYKKVSVDTMIRLGATVEQVGEVLYQLGSAGLTAEESLAALKSTMDAIIGSEADMTTYTKAVAATYNNFAEQITHVMTLQEKFKYINDVMVTAFREHQIEMNELTEGMKHLTATGKESNLQFHEMVGILATLNDHLIKSGIAGRSTQSVLSRITKQGREFAKAFKIEFDPNAPIDFIKILIDVNRNLNEGKLTANEVGKIFERLGLRGAKSFIQLVRYVDELVFNIHELKTSSSGAAEEMANIMKATPEAIIKRMGRSLEALSRTIFDVYVQYARLIGLMTANFTSSTREASQGSMYLSESLKTLISSIVNSIIVITLFRKGLKFLVSDLNKSKKVVASVITFLGKHIWIIVAIATAIALVVKWISLYTRKLERLREQVAKTFNEFKEAEAAVQGLSKRINELSKINYGFLQKNKKARDEFLLRHPQFIARHDEEGNAILKNHEAILAINEALKEQRRIQQQIAKEKFAESSTAQIKLLKQSIEDANTAIDKAMIFAFEVDPSSTFGLLAAPALVENKKEVDKLIAKYKLLRDVYDKAITEYTVALGKDEEKAKSLANLLSILNDKMRKLAENIKGLTHVEIRLPGIDDDHVRIAKELAGKVRRTWEGMEKLYKLSGEKLPDDAWTNELYKNFKNLEDLPKLVSFVTEKLKEGFSKADILSSLTIPKAGTTIKLFSDMKTFFERYAVDKRFRIASDLESANKELVEQNNLLETYNEILLNNKDLKATYNKEERKTIKLLMRIVGYKQQEIQLDIQRGRILRGLNDQLEAQEEKIKDMMLSLIPQGDASKIIGITRNYEKALKAQEKTHRNSMANILDQKKSGALRGDDVEKEQNRKRAMNEKINIALGAKHEVNLRRAIEDTTKAYNRQIEDRHVALEKLTFETKVYLTEADRWRKIEMGIEATGRQLNREMVDRQIHLDRLNESLTDTSLRGEKTIEQIEEEIDRTKTLLGLDKEKLALLLKTIPAKKELYEIEKRLRELDKAGFVAETLGDYEMAERLKVEKEFYEKRERLQELYKGGFFGEYAPMPITSDEIDALKRYNKTLEELAKEEIIAFSKAAIDAIDRTREKWVSNLRIMAEANIRFGKGLTKFKGMFDSFRVGLTSGYTDLAQTMESIGQSFQTGWTQMWQETLVYPIEALEAAQEELDSLRSERADILKQAEEAATEGGYSPIDESGKTVLASDEDVERMKELNEEMKKLKDQVDDLQNPLKRAEDALKQFTKVFLQELQRQMAALLAYIILRRIAGLAIGAASSSSAGTAGTAGTPAGMYNMPVDYVPPDVYSTIAQEGRYITGGVPGKDSVLLAAMPGEYIVRKSAVDYYGLDTFRKLNNMEISRYQSGGVATSKSSMLNVSGVGGSPEAKRKGTTNYYFIQATDVDSFRRLLIVSGETVDDISKFGLMKDLDDGGPVARRLGGGA